MLCATLSLTSSGPILPLTSLCRSVVYSAAQALAERLCLSTKIIIDRRPVETRLMADLRQRRRAEAVVFKLASGDLDQLGALGQIVGAAVFEGRFAAAGNVARLRHGRLPTPPPAPIPHLFLSFYQVGESGSHLEDCRFGKKVY